MPREKKRHKIEVHVAGICYRETETDIEVLIAKRNNEREIYPGKWECGGGQVREGENFEEAIKRQMKEELGIIVEKISPFCIYDIDMPKLDKKKIPGICFICFFNEYVNGKEPEIDASEHTEWKWQSVNNLKDVDFIPILVNDIRRGWDFYTMHKNILDEKNRENCSSDLI